MGGYVGLAPAGFPNVALSNLAKDWRNNLFVGDMIAPRVPVDRQSFQYVIWSRDDFHAPSTLRAPGAAPGTIRKSYSTDTYFCRSHALDTNIPFESEAYGLGLGFSSRQKATESLAKRLNLAREIEIANIALSTSNFPNGVTLSGGSQWDSYLTTPEDDTIDTVTSNPIPVIDSYKQLLRQSGVQDQDMILICSDPVTVALRSHPWIVDRFKFTNTGGIVTDEMLQRIFGVGKFVTASAISHSQNNTSSWVWGYDAFLGYAQAAPSLEDVSCLKTFSWTGAQDGGVEKGMVAPGADGFAVLEWTDPHLSKKTYWQSADWYYGVKVTAVETGIPILSAVNSANFPMGTVPTDIEG